MNHELQIQKLALFVQYRTYILQALNQGKETDAEDSAEQAEYLFFLSNMPVSKRSIFADMEWDFNDDYPNVARAIRGSKQRIEFLRYPAIPPFVLTEMKALLHLIHLNPLIFQPEKKGKRIRGQSKLKINTILAQFKSGLSYLNTLFEFSNELYGKEHIQNAIASITAICASDYREAAKRHDGAYSVALRKFFAYLSHPYTKKNILDGAIPGLDLDTLEWKVRAKKGDGEKDQILPNHCFETLSVKSSLLIADFLEAMEEEVRDQRSLRFLNNEAERPSQKAGLTLEIFNAYRVLRLRAKGYSEEFIRRYPIRSEFCSKSGRLEGYGQIDRLSRPLYERNTLRLYLNTVYYACTYIVGQYTGMRNSELSEVIVQDEQCLVEKEGFWLIESGVHKHQETLAGLFDDTWVAIPIVRDAIKAASLISTIKANPYLASNMDTVKATAEPNSMISIKHQMDTFLPFILGEELASKIDFNPYMLRHTLAYQLFRADLGLPFISYQLKHFVSEVESYTSIGATSEVTLGYGDIGEQLSQGGKRKNKYRHKAEIESVQSIMDPDGVYIGPKAEEHKERLKTVFQGYMAAGYTKEEVFEQMAEQGLALVNVGQGYCYGGQVEDFDDSLPCIGGLRCNPIRCSNALVGKQNAPKWREVYYQNKANLNKPEYSHNVAQIKEAMNEAARVLEYLGEGLDV